MLLVILSQCVKIVKSNVMNKEFQLINQLDEIKKFALLRAV